MRDNPQQPKCTGGSVQVLRIIDGLHDTIHVDVLDTPHVVGDSKMAPASTVTNWSIDPANGDLDEDDVHGERPCIVRNSPSPEVLVGHCNTNTAEALRRRRLFLELYCLQVRNAGTSVISGNNTHWIRERGYCLEVDERDENLIGL